MTDRAVVIGGSGFLGSHVADALSASGYQTVVFDSGQPRFPNPAHEVVLGSILDSFALDQAIQGATYVFNFAGIADIGECAKNPLETIRINVVGNAQILESCIRHNVRRFLFGSSIYVYGRHGGFYRASKQSSEAIIEAYHQHHGLPFTILRYGSLYGPRAQAWNGIARYVRQAIESGEIEFNGTGEERRDYIHVEDAARLSVDTLDGAFANESVIVTGTQTLTSRELTTMINEMLGGNIKVKFNKANGDTHYTMTPFSFAPRRAKKLVGDRFIDLGEGLIEVIREIHQSTES